MPVSIFCLFICGFSVVFNEELIQAHIYFRHGNRYPTKSIPNERHAAIFKDKYGQLTQKGLITEYNLGKKSRERYVDNLKLIASYYQNKEVSVVSSDVDRTLMSGEAFLAGFFEPVVEQLIIANLSWSPVPIHTRPVSYDSILRSTHSECQNLRKKIDEKDILMDQIQLDSNILADLKRVTGFKSINAKELSTIYDYVRVEKDMNLESDPIFTESVVSKIFDVVKKQQSIFFGIDDNDYGRLLAGPLINDILQKISITNNPIRLYVNSAHETTLAYLHSALGLNYVPLPDYGDATAVEVWKKDNNQLVVKVFWRKSNGNFELAKDFDLLDSFAMKLEPIRSMNRDLECSGVSNDPGVLKVYIYALGCCLVIALLLIILLIIKYKHAAFKVMN